MLAEVAAKLRLEIHAICGILDLEVGLRQEIGPRDVLVLNTLERVQNRNLLRRILLEAKVDSLLERQLQHSRWRNCRQGRLTDRGLRKRERGEDQEAEQRDVENNRCALALLRIFVLFLRGFGFFPHTHNLVYDGLIETTFGDQFATEAMHFAKQDLSCIVYEADAAEIDAEPLAGRGSEEFTPALLKGRHPLSGKAPFHT